MTISVCIIWSHCWNMFSLNLTRTIFVNAHVASHEKKRNNKIRLGVKDSSVDTNYLRLIWVQSYQLVSRREDCVFKSKFQLLLPLCMIATVSIPVHWVQFDITMSSESKLVHEPTVSPHAWYEIRVCTTCWLPYINIYKYI